MTSVFNKDLYKGKVVFVVRCLSPPLRTSPPHDETPVDPSLSIQTGGGTGICYGITKSLMQRESLSPRFKRAQRPS